MNKKFRLSLLFACMACLLTCIFSACAAPQTEKPQQPVEHSHVWDEGTITLSPTCVNKGEKTYTCVDESCTETSTEEIAALGHDLHTFAKKEASCLADGHEAYEYCSRCEYITDIVTIPKLGHDMQSCEEEEPTCLADGHEAYEYCSRCEYTTDIVTIPKLGHDLHSHEALSPTCTQIGYLAYEACSRCEYSTYEELPALGHNEVPHGALAPTCTEDGHQAYVTCSRNGCNYTTYKTISKLDHDLQSFPAQEATYDEDGWEAYVKCKRDNCSYTTYQVIPALQHNVVQRPAKAATCLEYGWNAYLECTDEDCNYSTFEQAKIPALGHNEIEHGALAPTCTEDGHQAYVTCSRCSHSTYVKLETLGHDLEYHDAKAATCTEIGHNAYESCKRSGCNHTTKITQSATGHSYSLTAQVDATCTKTGTKTYTCSSCSDSYTDTVKALGHDIVNHRAKAATCTQKGNKAYVTCNRCDHTTYEEIAALGHSYALSSKVSATCTQDGTETYTCSSCNDSYTNTVAKLGHSIDKDGKCSTCNTQIETYQSEIKTAPTLSIIYAGNQPTVSGGSVKGSNGVTLSGKWTLEDTSSTTASGSSTTITSTETFTLTFTPTNSSAYASVSIEVTVSFYAVAKYGNTYYASIDGALAAANAANSGTVIALPSTYVTETNSAKAAKTISTTTEIKSGVTLSLPWTTDSSVSGYSSSGKANTSDVTLLALSLTNEGHAYKNSKLVNQVLINGDLTNNGTITIGGIITAKSGAPATCITTGSYGQITLCEGASLTNNGKLNVYGYIQEEKNGTGKVINNGQMQMPFSLVEQRGGQIFLGFYRHGLDNSYTSSNGGAAPFNRFFAINAFVTVVYNPNSTLSGYVDLYANDEHNETSVALIATKNDSALINMAENSVLETKTDKNTLITALHVYGNISVNNLSLSISFSIMPIAIDTQKVLLPISWYFNVYMHKYKSGANATVTLSQNIKLLPGSVLEIDSGVTVNGDYLAIYDSFPVAEVDGAAHVYYMSGNSYVAYDKSYNVPAKLILNGTLNVNTLGGTVKTTSNNAVLNVKSSNQAIIRELNNLTDATWNLIVKKVNYKQPIYSQSTINLTLSLYENGSASTKTASAGKYVSYNGAWISAATEFAVSYVYIDESGNPIANVTNPNPTTYSMSSDTALKKAKSETAGWAFVGWYLDSNLTTPFDILNGGTLWEKYQGAATIYGKFIQAEEYAITFDFDNQTTGYTLSHDDVVEIEGTTVVLSNLQSLQTITDIYGANSYTVSYYFDGWYLGEEKVESLTLNGNYTLKARWIQKVAVTVKIQNGSSDSLDTYTIKANNTQIVSANPSRNANTTTTYYVVVGDTLTITAKAASGYSAKGATLTVAGEASDLSKGSSKTVEYTVTENDIASGINVSFVTK